MMGRQPMTDLNHITMSPHGGCFLEELSSARPRKDEIDLLMISAAILMANGID